MIENGKKDVEERRKEEVRIQGKEERKGWKEYRTDGKEIKERDVKGRGKEEVRIDGKEKEEI